MSGRVIQGFFVNGRGRPLPATVQRAQPVGTVNTRPMPGPPPPAFAGRALIAQAKPAPGRPPLVHQTAQVAQPFGGADSFEIDPAQVGLARGGGRPLPQAVLAKMEAAFGADFSTVRVHEGPQAPRIGAVAFTMGEDLYFAPGQYRPESIQGQQLIGHELAHVIQQRQGRVRAPGSGISVVQDRALEAEADRLGMRAANCRTPPDGAGTVQSRPAVTSPSRAGESTGRETVQLAIRRHDLRDRDRYHPYMPRHTARTRANTGPARAGVRLYAPNRQIVLGLGAAVDFAAAETLPAQPHTTIMPSGRDVRTTGGWVIYGAVVNGRRTSVSAKITPLMLRTGTAAAYDFPFFTRRFGLTIIRGHLLARVLGGSGHNPRNLIPMDHSLNNLPMYADVERRIQRHLERRRDYVRFRAVVSYDDAPAAPHPLSIFPTALTISATDARGRGLLAENPTTIPLG